MSERLLYNTRSVLPRVLRLLLCNQIPPVFLLYSNLICTPVLDLFGGHIQDSLELLYLCFAHENQGEREREKTLRDLSMKGFFQSDFS